MNRRTNRTKTSRLFSLPGRRTIRRRLYWTFSGRLFIVIIFFIFSRRWHKTPSENVYDHLSVVKTPQRNRLKSNKIWQYTCGRVVYPRRVEYSPAGEYVGSIYIFIFFTWVLLCRFTFIAGVGLKDRSMFNNNKKKKMNSVTNHKTKSINPFRYVGNNAKNIQPRLQN